MQVRTVLIWSLLNEKNHQGLRESEKTIKGMQPVIDALFPGINYFSVTGFGQVLNTRAKPALKKLFPELLTTPEEEVTENAMTEVPEFLPSKGYQWQDDGDWGARFDELLKAA